MLKEEKKGNQNILMDRILEVRNTDLEEEKRVCVELLARSDRKGDVYGLAFAYVYLFDSVLALGVYTDCDFYLSRAITLCKENKFDYLFMTLCNLAGLYYLKLSDEQTAIQFFLEGLDLAKRFQDTHTSSKLFNNMGMAFSGRDDWEMARIFFEDAYQEILKDNQSSEDFIMSYLSNLAETYIHLGEMDKAKEFLELSSQYRKEQFYYKIRVKAGWCIYYAKHNDKENCLKIAKEIYELHPEEYDNKFFVCDMIEGLVSDMINIQEYRWAEKFLELFNEVIKDTPIVVKYRIQCVKIRCLEALGKEEELKKEYRNYYEVARQLATIDSMTRAQSMLSKIQLHKVFHEREEMQVRKEFLETEIQLDKLTGLYNRRYFNKLSSKAILNKEIRTLAIIMIDIDFFKQYNDYYGHFMGDKVLKKVAKVLNQYVIEGIYACRYGGDEFVCLCQNISVEEIEVYIQNVRQGIKESYIEHAKSTCSDNLTLSLGYCHTSIDKDYCFDKILERADRALYRAKESGRNCYFKEDIKECV